MLHKNDTNIKTGSAIGAGVGFAVGLFDDGIEEEGRMDVGALVDNEKFSSIKKITNILEIFFIFIKY